MTVPLVAHVIHRMGVGGMENGLVNLIDHLPHDRFRHVIVSLTECTSFRERIRRDGVECISLRKRSGHDLGLYYRLWRVMRQLGPTIVHTRNLASIEAVLPAALAGVPIRVHGEHGRDMQDLDGTTKRYQWLRRFLAPLVHRFVALSGDLEAYLVDRVGVSASKVVRIVNGVDLHRFRPLPREPGELVIGCVTRMQEVKDPITLARAFVQLVSRDPAARVRLVMVGDGPLLPRVAQILRDGGVADSVSLTGERDDVAELLRGVDVFALSSRVEGISNTILEAMACGLPVVATRVGGNAELVEEGVTGMLVPPESPEAMATALASYVRDRKLARVHGRAARIRAEREFGLEKMVLRYTELYDELLSLAPQPVHEETSTTCAG